MLLIENIIFEIGLLELLIEKFSENKGVDQRDLFYCYNLAEAVRVYESKVLYYDNFTRQYFLDQYKAKQLLKEIQESLCLKLIKDAREQDSNYCGN